MEYILCRDLLDKIKDAHNKSNNTSYKYSVKELEEIVNSREIRINKLIDANLANEAVARCDDEFFSIHVAYLSQLLLYNNAFSLRYLDRRFEQYDLGEKCRSVINIVGSIIFGCVYALIYTANDAKGVFNIDGLIIFVVSSIFMWGSLGLLLSLLIILIINFILIGYDNLYAKIKCRKKLSNYLGTNPEYEIFCNALI